MWELCFISVTDDGTQIIVRSPDLDDEEFLLPVTEDLRDALTPAARPPRPALSGDEALTPRDIQARIRGGESPEVLARAAGVPLAKIDRFAGPVLAERAHVAEEARTIRLSWQGRGGGPGGTLDELLSARFQADGVAAETVTWDAWRRDGTVWIIEVAYLLGDDRHTAQWSWDPGRRQLRPYGAAARALCAPPGSASEPITTEPNPVIGLRMVGPASTGLPAASMTPGQTAIDVPGAPSAPPRKGTGDTGGTGDAGDGRGQADSDIHVPTLQARPLRVQGGHRCR